MGRKIENNISKFVKSESQNCSDLEKIEIELLLEGIFRFYGYDFKDYAFSSIRRRIWHRVRTEKLDNIAALLEQVLHNPEMMEKLAGDFSINVTEMFRDPIFFWQMRKLIIPELKKIPFIRVWHAGCSTGEEVYSMAILLQEEGLFDKVRIYATDINSGVLQRAKSGIFPVKQMQAYTKNYLQAGGTKAFSEYYQVRGNKVIFHPDLSEKILFAQHNLATDGSFNEFHLIICRNVLIYFNQILQSRVHQLFYQSLSLSGFLGLGNKEGMINNKQAKCYEVLDSKQNLFRKVK